MSIKAALRTYCIGVTGISTLISTRMHYGQAPASTARPYVVYNRISAQHTRNMAASGGLARERIQIRCVADTGVAAEAIAQAFRAALDGYQARAMGAVFINSCTLDNEVDTFITPTDGSDRGRHEVIQDYLIWHTESIPTFA